MSLDERLAPMISPDFDAGRGTENTRKWKSADSVAKAVIGESTPKPAPADAAPPVEALEAAAATPRDPEYVHLNRYRIAAAQQEAEDHALDKIVRDFRDRPGVDYFDDRSVLQLWYEMDPNKTTIEKAHSEWLKRNLSIEAVCQELFGQKIVRDDKRLNQAMVELHRRQAAHANRTAAKPKGWRPADQEAISILRSARKS